MEKWRIKTNKWVTDHSLNKERKAGEWRQRSNISSLSLIRSPIRQRKQYNMVSYKDRWRWDQIPDGRALMVKDKIHTGNKPNVECRNKWRHQVGRNYTRYPWCGWWNIMFLLVVFLLLLTQMWPERCYDIRRMMNMRDNTKTHKRTKSWNENKPGRIKQEKERKCQTHR